MSDAGTANSTAQMPDQVKIQSQPANPGPGNVQPAPQTPTMQRGDLPQDGSFPGFAGVTKAIMDMAQAKSAEMNAGKDALNANIKVDQSAATSISGLTTDTLAALGNIKKAQSLPLGAGGDIAQILSIFNSDYDVDAQQTRIKINQTKAAQISATAAAIKEQNNALPALLAKNSEASKDIFEAYKETSGLALQGQQYKLDLYKADIDRKRLMLQMTAEQREQATYKVNNLTTAQAEAILPQAQSGKGPWAPLAGMIEHKLVQEKTAIIGMQNANNALQKGNREEYNSSLVDTVSHFPMQASEAAINAAKANNSPMVSFPTGQKDPKTGKPLTLDVPYNLAELGWQQAKEMDQKTDTMLAADISEKGKLLPNIQNLINAAAGGVSTGDPRFSQIVTRASNIMKTWDPKNPAQTQQVLTIVKGMNDELAGVYTDHAKSFTTKEAQAAVETAGKNGGNFDVQGGSAVMADSAGIPGLMKSARYSSMWNTYNIGVAQALVSQGLATGGVNGNADASAILAQVLNKPNGRQKIAEASARYLADPKNIKPLQGAMTGRIQSASVEDVIGKLASQKGADPMWTNLLEHKADWEVNGSLSIEKLFDAMEYSTIKNHVNGKQIDMSKLFMQQLRNHAANAGEASMTDPSYTIQDHAAEAALFGNNPAGAVLHDLFGQLTGIAARARATMKQRVNKDVTGQTYRDAVMHADPFFEPQPGMGWNDVDKIKKHTGVDMLTVPSATGAGVTAEQIRKTFPGGLN